MATSQRDDNMTVLRVAQVKCRNCGRVCGEVQARSVQGLSLENVYVPKYAEETGLSKGALPRCGRCGGMVYIDEPFAMRRGELLAIQATRRSPNETDGMAYEKEAAA